MVVMYILFLGVVPIAAIIFLCWYCFLRDQHQRSITWSKIHRLTGPSSKASLPCVNLPSHFIPCAPSPSVKAPLLQCHKESLQKSDVPDDDVPLGVPQVLVQSSPKTKLKTFGVASELLIVQKVEISPSLPRRNKSDDTSGASQNGSGLQGEKRLKDIRTWMKDRLHLKIPSLKRSFSNSTPTPSSSSTTLSPFYTPLSSPLAFTPPPPPPQAASPLLTPPPPPPQAAKPFLTPTPPPPQAAKPFLTPPPPPPPQGAKPFLTPPPPPPQAAKPTPSPQSPLSSKSIKKMKAPPPPLPQ